MIKLARPECPDAVGLKTDYAKPINKAALVEASHSKCMYCETEVTATYWGDVEHIKPKSLFPEEKFNWSNLGFVCAKCNNEKRHKYDITLPFINPYDEDPEDHIIFLGFTMHHKRGSERGQSTIKELDLNRDNLIQRRADRIKMVQGAIDACFRTKNKSLREDALKDLLREADPSHEYSLCIKFVLKGHGILQ